MKYQKVAACREDEIAKEYTRDKIASEYNQDLKEIRNSLLDFIILLLLQTRTPLSNYFP